MVSWELWRRISRLADVTITLLLPCSRISSLISEVKGRKKVTAHDLVDTYQLNENFYFTE